MKRYFISLILLAGCATRTPSSDQVISMQLLDRNGFSETISNKDRLDVYKNVDFVSAQPYQKVLRVFGRDSEGKSHSKITSYHPNGHIWQYLEAVDGRAHGLYKQWHENGILHVQSQVIEGMADLSEIAQASWLFDGVSTVWDEDGIKQAEFIYDKGHLEGPSYHFHKSGQPSIVIPYEKGVINGKIVVCDEQGNTLEEAPYAQGVMDGLSKAIWAEGKPKYNETYQAGALLNASYWNTSGELVASIENGSGQRALFLNEVLQSLIEYKEGKPEGKVQLFTPQGILSSIFHQKNDKKDGEEWEFYAGDQKHPKLLIPWHEDKVQGVVKTWYENGLLESEREMSGSKKHGHSFAYYKSGDLMLMEEYDNDKLLKGAYYLKGEKKPASTIEGGQGVATLYTPEGFFLKKITYEQGKPTE